MNTLTPFIEHNMQNLPNDTHNTPAAFPSDPPSAPPSPSPSAPPSGPDSIPHPQPANVPQCRDGEAAAHPAGRNGGGGCGCAPLGHPPLQAADCGINGLDPALARLDPDRRENKTARMKNVSCGAHGRGCPDRADRMGTDSAGGGSALCGGTAQPPLSDAAQKIVSEAAHGGVMENGGIATGAEKRDEPDKNFGYGSKQVFPAVQDTNPFDGLCGTAAPGDTLRAGTSRPACRCAPMRQKNAQDFLDSNTPGIMAFYAPEHMSPAREAALRDEGHPADPSSRNTAAEGEETVLRLLEWREESPNS